MSCSVPSLGTNRAGGLCLVRKPLAVLAWLGAKHRSSRSRPGPASAGPRAGATALKESALIAVILEDPDFFCLRRWRHRVRIELPQFGPSDRIDHGDSTCFASWRLSPPANRRRAWPLERHVPY